MVPHAPDHTLDANSYAPDWGQPRLQPKVTLHAYPTIMCDSPSKFPPSRPLSNKCSLLQVNGVTTMLANIQEREHSQTAHEVAVAHARQSAAAAALGGNMGR